MSSLTRQTHRPYKSAETLSRHRGESVDPAQPQRLPQVRQPIRIRRPSIGNRVVAGEQLFACGEHPG
ncbi:MAG: hypothetical protein RMJ82_09275, partial [Gemmatales bacterium]|nr:hypothetical protein [Gemmatales bacterium]